MGRRHKSAKPQIRRWRVPFVAIVVLVVFAAALSYARDRIPGITNDAAEEGLRGLYLVEGPHFEVITTHIGYSAETLYLYLLGGMAKLLGPTSLSIQLTSWLFALATILLIWQMVQRISDTVPAWVSLLVAASSIWLFHYARSGLRAITAPFFLAAFALLLDRMERRPQDRTAALYCGGVLGLSIYAYTSNRILPIAFMLYAVLRVVRSAQKKIAMRRYGEVVAAALVVSIPNILLLLHRPHDFFYRGAYLLKGTPVDYASNLLWSALYPFYYPPAYRQLRFNTYFSDPVTAGFTSAGFNALHIVISAALLAGLWQIRRVIHKPIAAYLVCSWIAGLLALGFLGPSLTRMLILLPVYLVFAALGFAALIQFRPQLRSAVLLLLLWVGVSNGYEYLSGGGISPKYSGPATIIGQRAEYLASRGQRVLCIISRDHGVVDYLTHDQADRVAVMEFFEVPLNEAQIPWGFQPHILIVENTAAFAPFLERIPANLPVAKEDGFTQIRLR